MESITLGTQKQQIRVNRQFGVSYGL